jgi:hypothetical protein
MSRRTTLLTAHKGVDLHAATAVRVMRDRLEGGDRLAALFRCEMHSFVGEPAGVSAERLLDNGRYFNPNKHHYGCFVLDGDGDFGDTAGGALAAAWPGDPAGTDLAALAADGPGLYARLLGGPVPDGCTAVDVAAWARDQQGPVTSGVLWRLVLRAGADEAGALGELLAVARERKQGLLINPHMEAWRTVVR